MTPRSLLIALVTSAFAFPTFAGDSIRDQVTAIQDLEARSIAIPISPPPVEDSKESETPVEELQITPYEARGLPPDGTYVVTDPTWCVACAQPQNSYKPAAIKMEALGWTFRNATFGVQAAADFQIIDRVDPDGPQQIVLDLLGEDYTIPCAVHVENGEITRRWGAECEKPLDSWVLGWLATGEDKRPHERPNEQVAGRYPLRGGWWSIDRNWNHDRAFALLHMKTVHGSSFDRAWLESLSQAELESLHSDVHEGRVHWDYAVRPGHSKSEPVVRLQSPQSSPQSSCPNCYNARRKR